MSFRAHELIDWIEITRFGMPQFTVSRRPMTVQGETYPVGSLLPEGLLPNKTRIRQLYEQRFLAVIPESVLALRPDSMPPLKRLAFQVANEVPVAPGVKRVSYQDSASAPTDTTAGRLTKAQRKAAAVAVAVAQQRGYSQPLNLPGVEVTV